MKTILIVDPDSAGNGVGDLLNRKGFTSMIAAEARTALARVRSGMPLDLVITELLLPDMDGIDFLGDLRNARPGLPVLVLTASGSIQAYLHAMNLGVVDYISKPIRTKELSRIVTTFLDRGAVSDSAGPPNAA